MILYAKFFVLFACGEIQNWRDYEDIPMLATDANRIHQLLVGITLRRVFVTSIIVRGRDSTDFSSYDRGFNSCLVNPAFF